MHRSLGHGLNHLLHDKLDFGGVSNSVYVVACKYALRLFLLTVSSWRLSSSSKTAFTWWNNKHVSRTSENKRRLCISYIQIQMGIVHNSGTPKKHRVLNAQLYTFTLSSLFGRWRQATIAECSRLSTPLGSTLSNLPTVFVQWDHI